jgi:hypothetical protein
LFPVHNFLAWCTKIETLDRRGYPVLPSPEVAISGGVIR